MNTNSQERKNDSSGISRKQKEWIKKAVVFSLMGMICAGCLWFIFAPSEDDKAGQQAQAGFNTEIPDPKSDGLIGDKRDAYEQEQIRRKQEEKRRSLEDFSALLGDKTPKTGELALLAGEPEAPSQKAGGGSYTPPRQSSVQTSAQIYRDMNRVLGSFYEKPENDPEKEALKEELEALKMRMEESENRKDETDKQLALMENSFRMAAKYMPGANGTPTDAGTASADVRANGKAPESVPAQTAPAPVGGVREQTVSLLQAEISAAEFMENYSAPRNLGFLTLAAETGEGVKNTLSACVQESQTVVDGQSVRLRLLEPMRAGKMLIPRHTLLSGTAKIQGERLGISIRFLEYRGTIVPLELSVYDADGQAGIFIPDLQELSAAREIVAGMGTSAGTSISLSSDAGGQFAADMGRNLIQGVSQFTAKKLREVKVHLKAGHRVFLLPEGNLSVNN